MTPTFIRSRGETLSLALEAVEGDVSAATCRADLKRAVRGEPPPAGTAPDASFEVAPSAEVAPGGGPGWLLTLAAGVTAALPPGLYFADALVTMPGFAEQTDMIRIELRERVTE